MALKKSEIIEREGKDAREVTLLTEGEDEGL